MKRLTERDEYGNADIIALSDVMPEIYASLSFSETNSLTEALNRLADYEDSGILPDKLAEKERIDTWLVNLPSVQQEQNLAYWIGAELGKCSSCGHSGCASDIWNGCLQKFCPNCGAKMESEEIT